MRSPWGEISVQDAHSHLFGRSFFEGLARQKGTVDTEGMVASLGWESPPESDRALAARWVGELDRYGVDRIALMASLPGDEGAAAEAAGAFPDRIYGYFMLDPFRGDALERARHAFDNLGLQGVCLFPAMHRFSVRDERLAAVYRLAGQVPGRVVFVHMGMLTVGVRAKLGLPCPFDMAYSNPIDLHGVALANPQTNFVIPHFGAGYLREALMLAALAPNVYLDTSSSNSWRRLLHPRPSLANVFDMALEAAGPGRLLFGTDSSFFPRGWNHAVFEAQCAAMDSIGLSGSDAQAILGGNLGRLLSAV